MKKHEQIMQEGNLFMGYSIPLVSYTYENQEQLNKDLVEILDEIEDFYKSTKTKNTSNLNTDGNTNTKSVLTKNFSNFNVLDRLEYESIKSFKTFVSNCYKDYIKNYMQRDFENLSIQCWGNKVGKFDFLDKHAHIVYLNDNTQLSGNYFVKSPGHETYTRYYSPLAINKEEYTYIKNQEGMLTIFPSFVEHDTSPNRSAANYRYTLGMDVMQLPEEARSAACLVDLV